MMLTNEEQLIIDDLLQRDVCIRYNNKVIRKGIFTLYSVKDFVITVILKNADNESTRNYEMYKPYKIIAEKGRVIFDYTLSTLCSENKVDLVDSLFKDKSKHKFFNSKVVVEIQPTVDYNNNGTQV